CLLETGLLALDDASVAGQEASLLEGTTVRLGVDLVEGTVDAKAQRAGLTGDAATLDAGVNVELALDVEQRERGVHELLVHLVGEVVLDVATVDGPLAGSENQAHAGHGLLATTKAGAGRDVGGTLAANGRGLSGVLGGGVVFDDVNHICHVNQSLFLRAYCATCEISNACGCCAAWGCSGPA